MPDQFRGKSLVALGALWALCLGSLGCQIQIGYSILGGPLAKPASAGTSDKKEAPAAKPAVGETPQDVAQTSYQAIDYSRKPVVPRALAPVSVMPELRAIDGPPLQRTTVTQEAAPTVAKPTEGPALTQLPPFEPTTVAAAAAVQSSGPSPSGPCASGVCTAGCSSCAGDCHAHADGAATAGDPGERGLPTELARVAHPPYMIEPPDILLIDAIRMVPRGAYTAQALDVLLIRVTGTLPNQAIEGAYTVAPDGTINLGFSYGSIRVVGMSLEDIQNAIRQQLRRGGLVNPQVAVGLGQFRGLQQVRGEHLVRQDGTISLGTYGCVFVTGLTIPQAKCAIEKHLSQFLVEPEVSLDVFAYNSKVYYVILDGGGYGQQVFRFPITGSETVLDAISHIQGLPTVASKRHIHVARPAPADHPCVQILPVDWNAITQGGATSTNWQIFPGDRIYVKADPLIALDNMIAKIVSPIQRVLGVAYLGASTAQVFRSNGNNSNATPLVVVP